MVNESSESFTFLLLQIFSFSALALMDPRKEKHEKLRDEIPNYDVQRAHCFPELWVVFQVVKFHQNPWSFPASTPKDLSTCAHCTSSSLALALVFALLLKKLLSMAKSSLWLLVLPKSQSPPEAPLWMQGGLPVTAGCIRSSGCDIFQNESNLLTLGRWCLVAVMSVAQLSVYFV